MLYGIAKLNEECGEVVQVVGKLMAYPKGKHPDGGEHLHKRLVGELADVQAALLYFMKANPPFDTPEMVEYFEARAARKLQKFTKQWRMSGIASRPPLAPFPVLEKKRKVEKKVA